VKEVGDHWIVQEKKGRKIFSRGVWAPAATIDRIRAELEAVRCTEGYAKRKEADARRREKAQAEYVEDFHGAVLAFLAFYPTHADLADRLARAVTDHATPVGSGTVARTKRIPIERRAEAAVIAWLRHQTTAYDDMVIPRIKGKRREVRRMLAQRSQELLVRYRRGESAQEGCPLRRGLIWGMVVPATPFPRLALTAHIQLTANGIMFLVAGVVILRLPIAKSGVSAKILVAGPWLTWLVMFSEMANAWWGTRNMLPIAAGQAGAAGAQPWQETSVTVAHLIGALVLIVYWGVILAGLVRMPINARETTTDQPPA
jgi:hypothetical protein